MTAYRGILAAIVFGAAFAAAPARAQIFTGLAPRQPLVIPAPGAVTPPPAGASAVVVPATPGPTASVELMHHLPHTLEGFKLTGESGDLQWPVYLTRAQANGSLRFHLGYLSAVSTLEEASTLTLKLNGRAVGTVAINAPQAIKSVDFPIPPGLAANGYNALSLSVEQRHRVDCSVAATYELWTKIDPTQTGLVVEAPLEAKRDLHDLPALLPYGDGTMPIRIVLAVKTNPAQIQRYLKVTQQLAIAGHFLQPTVDFGPFAEDANGVNLVIGTRVTLRNLPRLGDAAGLAGPSVSLVGIDGIKRPTLVVSGDDDAEVDAAIETLAVVRPLEGTPAGRQAIATYPGLETIGDTRLSLMNFGIASQEFSGRLYRKSFNISLPADFLSADYARGTFDLAGGYAAALGRDSQVRIDVNGRNAGQVKLPNAAGDVFRHNQLFLPLALMRPGLNRIDIVAETPKAEDATCDTSRSLGTDKRFLLLETSELALPVLARVQRLPDLALTTGGGLPFTTGKPKLFVPQPDKDTMAAALSLAARAGVAAGKVIPFEFTATRPTDDTGSTLVVAAARALDPALMSEVGLDPALIETAWRDRAKAPVGGAPLTLRSWWTSSAEGPAACRQPRFASSFGPSASPTVEPAVSSLATTKRDETDALYDRWNTNLYGMAAWRDGTRAVSAQVDRWMNRLGRGFSWPTRTTESTTGIGPNASLILAQGMAAGSDRNVVTLVTAPDAATLRASVACLADPQIWTKVHGRLSVLDASDGTVTSTDAEHVHYAVAGPLSLGNSRLVLAGWLSLNPAIFVVIALLTALCLSGTTVVLLRGIGRKGPK